MFYNCGTTALGFNMPSSPNNTSNSAAIAIEIIEPFDRGAFVHFTHKLGCGLSTCGASVSLIASRDFELRSLERSYELIQTFKIPRDDLYSRAPKGLLKKCRWRLSIMRTRSIALLAFLRQFRKAVQAIAKRKPDFVFVGTVFRYPGMRYFLGRLQRSGIRVVQICHEFQLREEHPALLHRLLFKLNSKIYHSFDAIFFLSDAQRKLFLKSHPEFPSQRLFLLPMGNGDVFSEIADTRKWQQWQSQFAANSHARTVLFFGRIRSDKGVEDLLQAFATVAKNMTNIRLQLVGHARTEFAEVLLRRAKELGIEDRFQLHPHYLESELVWPVVKAAEIVVYPYRSSSQSASLQVAMSAGKPLIVTDAGGLPEVIQDGQNGLVVPARDPEALAAALMRLLSEPHLADTLGQNARTSANTTHAWHNVGRVALESLATL